VLQGGRCAGFEFSDDLLITVFNHFWRIPVVGVLIISAEGVIVKASVGSEKLLNWPPENLCGNSLRSLLLEERRFGGSLESLPQNLVQLEMRKWDGMIVRFEGLVSSTSDGMRVYTFVEPGVFAGRTGGMPQVSGASLLSNEPRSSSYPVWHDLETLYQSKSPQIVDGASFRSCAQGAHMLFFLHCIALS